MSEDWIWNPKTKGSGVITCIPQKGLCPNKCPDCFFQSGRSYLEPLDINLPHIPPIKMTKGRIVRINDGNDSNNQRKLVMQVAEQFDDYFYNTANPYKLKEFNAPVVLTVNPGELTNINFHMVEPTVNLMFIRVRVNAWNLMLVDSAIRSYSEIGVPIVLTFMAYYTESIPDAFKKHYVWQQRTINSYYCPSLKFVRSIEDNYRDNPHVYSCGYKYTHACSLCGNCVREYFNTKERMRECQNKK